MWNVQDSLLALTNYAAEFGIWGVVSISAIYIVATLLLVPGILITFAVTAAYGWWAIPICIANGLIASFIAFLLGRYVIRDIVRKLVQKNKTLAAFDAIAKEDSFRTVVLTRLVPIAPFALENYSFGATSARTLPYLVATLVGIVPGTILNVWIGV